MHGARLVLTAIAVIAALAQGGLSEHPVVWESTERDGQFTIDHRSTDVAHPSIDQTLLRWGTSHVAHLATTAIMPPFDLVLSVQAAGSTCSVNGTGTGSDRLDQYTCSTTNTTTRPLPSGGYDCSIQYSNPSDPSPRGCSVTTIVAVAYCSTGNNGSGDSNKPYLCSTQGGASSPGNPSNGSISCSTGNRGGVAGPGTCSTAQDIGAPSLVEVQCSTFTGNHQSCSAGRGPGDTDTYCSATTGANTSTDNTCSVIQESPPGKVQNKCSAFDDSVGPDTTTGVVRCSVFTTGSGTSLSQCSVAETAPSNARCTVMWPGPGNRFQCSAFDEDGEIIVPTSGACSTHGESPGVPIGNPPQCGHPSVPHEQLPHET